MKFVQLWAQRMLGIADMRLIRLPSEKQLVSSLRRLRPSTTEHPLIRVGGDNDGGYLLPDDLEGISACFSPGVGYHSEFELALANRGIPSFMADYSVDGPASSNDLFTFEKKFLGYETTDNTLRLSEWVNSCAAPEGDLLLQMDIEGAEWSVLIDSPEELLRRFRIIVLELHYIDRLALQADIELLDAMLTKLTRDFDVVHVHPNNVVRPTRYKGAQIHPLLEVTLLRKDRSVHRTWTREFPHPLDQPAVADKPEVVLAKCMWAD